MKYKFKQWLESVHVVAFLFSVIAVAMIIAAMTNDKGAYDVLPAVVPFLTLVFCTLSYNKMRWHLCRKYDRFKVLLILGLPFSFAPKAKLATALMTVVALVISCLLGWTTLASIIFGNALGVVVFLVTYFLIYGDEWRNDVMRLAAFSDGVLKTTRAMALDFNDCGADRNYIGIMNRVLEKYASLKDHCGTLHNLYHALKYSSNLMECQWLWKDTVKASAPYDYPQRVILRLDELVATVLTVNYYKENTIKIRPTGATVAIDDACTAFTLDGEYRHWEIIQLEGTKSAGIVVGKLILERT